MQISKVHFLTMDACSSFFSLFHFEEQKIGVSASHACFSFHSHEICHDRSVSVMSDDRVEQIISI